MADDKILPESEIAPDEHEVTAQPSGPNLEDVHKRVLDRFDSVALPQVELRAQSLAARRFTVIPGAMWEGAWSEQFENAPRPEVDMITKPMRKIETDYRQNRMMVDFRPADDKADQDTADFLDGKYRADDYRFKAGLARDNAFKEALRGGFGAYRLTTDYDDPYDKDNDHQVVNPALIIPDADQRVYFGPHVMIDGSDAPYAFVIHVDYRAEAEAKWGRDNIDEWPVTSFLWNWDWYRPDTVQTAEYYEVEETEDRLYVFTSDVTDETQRYFKSELQDGQAADLKAQGWKQTSRMVKRRRVHKYILNGKKVLKDCGYIAGCHIPIVPVYGEVDFVDGMMRWRGFVQKKMDASRIFNGQLATLVEISGSSSGDTPMVDPARIPPAAAEIWARRNIDRPAYLPLLPQTDAEGNIVKTDVDTLVAPQVPATTAAILQLTMGILTGDDENADEVKANVSAEAMDIAAQRVDDKSAIYIDNMRLAVQREGEIYLPMAREIYCEPGRKVDVLSVDGESDQATLMEPSLGSDKIFRIRNDLTQGKYKVVATVQEATATKRDKAVRQSLNVAEIAIKANNMEIAGAALLNAIENQDGEGMEKLQAFAHSKAVAIGLDEPTDAEKQELEQAQATAKPDPAAEALTATAAKENSAAKLNEAKAVQTLADAALKQAQADAVGGPERAHDVPTGLEAPTAVADVTHKLADADLKRAQAAHLQEQMQDKRIRRGHEINMDHAEHSLAERQQEHAERQPPAGGAD